MLEMKVTTLGKSGAHASAGHGVVFSCSWDLQAFAARARSARMCDRPKASRKAMIATTSGRLASQGGSGVMNGVTALSTCERLSEPA